MTKPQKGDRRQSEVKGRCIEAPALVVLCEDDACRDEAETLAAHLDASLVDKPEPGALHLRVTGEGLVLARDGMELRPDFAELLPRVKQGALQREMLVKAARQGR